MSGDEAMRRFGTQQEVPTFDDPAFTTLDRPVSECTVAIVTSAALHRADNERFSQTDTGYRSFDASDRDLVLGHWSPNFDRSGFAIDLDVVYPIDRLAELAERGVIGAVAPRHHSFAGNQPDTVSELRLDSGPACAAEMIRDGVDIVLLTPV